MKKLLILSLALSASAVMFSSCKKDYTCDCPSIKIPINDAKKKDAEKTCDAAKAVYGDCKLN